MKEELIRYRREKARETLEDEKILFKSGRLSSTLNRIYYAAFYEVVALLATNDLSSAKHTGAVQRKFCEARKSQRGKGAILFPNV
ncbi:MAG: HEPN domain-containing protein [Syntrophales bacterium]|jgi:uncharacterized protein (UPF0332 family)|nr:HEPN domain-containing protein [Syntrophales bacterium]